MNEEEQVKNQKIKVWSAILLVYLVFAAIFYFSFYFSHGAFSPLSREPAEYKTQFEKDEHVRFGMEVYDIIVGNYWQKVNEAELAELFRLSFGKGIGSDQTLISTDREGVARMLEEGLKMVSQDKKKSLIIDTGIIVLQNLYPQGRSGLLSLKQETEFRDNVNNINREQNLYSVIGVEDGASIKEVEKAYEEKKIALQKINSEESREELKSVNHAFDVLKDESTREIYNQTKIEPSLASRTTENNSLYLDLSNITAATFEEIDGKIKNLGENNKPIGIIIDLRNNVGGALDFVRYFFALFVGPNQYAYDLFQKGELNVWRTPGDITKVPALQDIDDIAILTDNTTQSTAELMAAVFKKFNLAQVVGATTKGWGTVENTFPVKTTLQGEEYTVLLVHSMTLREDGEGIDSKGVTPDISVTDPNWQKKLPGAFKSKMFAQDIIKIMQNE